MGDFAQTKRCVLHINSYYIDTHLYSKIYLKLANHYIQKVYIPIKQDRSEENKVDIPNTDLFFSRIIRANHKFLYFSKIKKLTKDIIDRGLYEEVDFVHAHNLFTDGAIALNLKRKYGIRYVVSVRMTDISIQYKYMLHRRSLARSILAEAEHVIFISPIYKDKLYGMMRPRFVQVLEHKTSIIPNGIDDFWHEESSQKLTYHNGEVFKLIYIGQLIKRKNLDKVLNVLEVLNDNRSRFSLTVIGGEHPNERQFYDEMRNRMDKLNFVEYRGVIRDHHLLKTAIAKSHALIMPATNELFGLVFIEAISQNTPVIYPVNEGITPYLEGKPVGVGVDANSEQSIRQGIIKLQEEYSAYDKIDRFSNEFDWNKLTEAFSLLYH